MTVLEQLKRVDNNAEQLYDKLIKAVGVTIDRTTGEVVQDKAGTLLFQFGIPDLLSRLESQQTIETRRGSAQDPIARARIWRHIAEASRPMANPKQGEGSIGDITDRCQVNAWLPDGAEKFTREMPSRKCDSCGMPWDNCQYHFAKDSTQQTDSSKSWFCFWCFKVPVVREAFGIKESSRGSCVLCKRPSEGFGLGGHVPVKDSDDWVCSQCVRANPALIVGSSAIPIKAPEQEMRGRCANKSCGNGRDERGNRVRARVPERGDFCSDPKCRKTAKEAKKDKAKRAKFIEPVSESTEGGLAVVG